LCTKNIIYFEHYSNYVDKCGIMVFEGRPEEILEQEYRKFFETHGRSLETWKRAVQLTPLGVHSNYRLTRPFPVYFGKGEGAYLTDVDGRKYIDFNMGFGALVSGHSNKVIVQELISRIENSTIFGFEDEESLNAAELINERFGTEMVRFSTTGTEATMHALRIARGYTGKTKVLKFEGCYHGSNQDLLFSVKPKPGEAGEERRPRPVPAGLGIPDFMKQGIVISQFNDTASTEELLDEYGEDIAAVILEPFPMNMGVIIPDREFIAMLRRKCDSIGAVLIFDEVKTCGKFYGGAEEVLGVRPDMKILGKAIGGGIPVSAIAGSSEMLSNIGPGKIAHAGTFNSNPLAMAAVSVTLGNVLTRSAMRNAQLLSQELAKGYSDLMADRHLEFHVPVAGLSGAISFNHREPKNWREFLKGDVGKWNYYYIAMLNRGVIPAGPGADEQWTVSVMHSKEEIENTLEAFKDIVPSIGMNFPLLEVEESV
jgi:glutamate-1-semialdehyde 2,1-aminomutase